MNNLSPRRLLTRAGTGAAAIALVAIAGYSVGQTQSPQRHRPPRRRPSDLDPASQRAARHDARTPAS